MDLQVYGRVIWRFKWIVMIGVLVAFALAALSMVRVSSKGVTYRQSVLWSSTTRLLVTQRGFPEGRLLIQPPGAQAGTGDIADPNRLNGLAILYAELATSDPVRALMLRDGPLHGKIIATPVAVGDNHFMLPLIDVMGIANSPQRAISLAERSADALRAYLEAEQSANAVPASDRVIVQDVAQPKKAKVFSPRSKTMPIVVFLAVMLATLGLAFLLENVRPRKEELGEPAAVELRRTTVGP